jgi:6-phosphogluconate dehydrogenase
MSELCDFGLIGLAVMGENLALNVESRGYRIAVYNRTTEKVDKLIKGRAAKGKNFVGCHSIEELVASLKKPRLVMTLVKAGPAVDRLLSALPHLEPGDVIIDGGNEHYHQHRTTHEIRRGKGIAVCGTGVSGGEEGALKGPSLMPGGSPRKPGL